MVIVVTVFYFLFYLVYVLFYFAEGLYDTINDDNPYEKVEYVASKKKSALPAVEPETVVDDDYCNPNTALKNINFSQYNLPGHSLLQSYKSMRENIDKLFVQEFKVWKNISKQ